jgi:cell division protein FtsQ
MARKSGGTILQEELYPPSAEVARPGFHDLRGHALRGHDPRHGDLRGDDPDKPDTEIDDARLLDLDVDEESPFLRGQKRISARRSSLPKKTANRLLWAVLAAGVVSVAGFAAAALYHYGEHSWRFRVESSDNIEITGMQNVTKSQIMEVMGADIGRNIFFIPLALQKAQLEQIPWVESASVMRFVPNQLKVQIHERTPVAFARVGSRMFLIDSGGTLMELTPKHKYSFPVILGMNPGEPLSTRAPRMKAYVEMVRDLDSGGARYSQDLSEVDLSDLEDVKVRVNDPQGDVLVHLGSSDYLSRYKIYVSHAQGWRQQFQKLESVDLRYDNQIIVNPDVPQTAKPVALSPAVAKAAVAAGVKPAALITRLPPHGRAVPKPAFELTDKELNPKAATGGGKKAAARTKGTKGKKTAAPIGKSAANTTKATKRAPVTPATKQNVTAKKTASKLANNHEARQASGGKQAAPSPKPTAKPPVSGGQKPSPAIAKSQVNQGPGL